MDTRLSEGELKTFNRWMRTDLGEKILAIIKESEQGYLDSAVAGFTKGKDYTHDCVVAAAAIETIYQFFKPPKEDEKTEE